jgi:hypothetical protein
MKRILDSPFTYARETLDGLCVAFSRYYRFAAGSTFGTLSATGFMAAGKVALGKTSFSEADLVALEAASDTKGMLNPGRAV